MPACTKCKKDPCECPPPGDTKVCESCDAVIGKNETECPKCKVNFEELEDTIATIDKAEEVRAKRKKATEPKTCAKCKTVHKPEDPCPPPAKKKPLRGLGAILRKRVA
jgi:RNA polymerase subunit RPABC4/transcription elongation factor Spt4